MSLRAFIVLAVVLVASSSHADEAQDRARTLNNAGNTAYDLGRYDEAIQSFSDAYKAYPDTRILFNLAQAHRKNHDYERALETYRTYLRNAPDAPNRAVVSDLIAELEALIAKQRSADIRPPQGTASTGPAPTSPLPVVITKIEEPRPWYASAAGWGLVGGGAIAAGVGVGFLASASSLEDQLATATDTQKSGLRSDINTRRTVGIVSAVVGGVAVAGGIAIFIFSPRTVTKEIVPIKDLRLSVGPGQFALRGWF